MIKLSLRWQRHKNAEIINPNRYNRTSYPDYKCITLESSEIQAFATDGMVCLLKEDKEGRFDLKIDGVSHHSWFRRKKDEFVEALGLPTSRRQNRGMKL